MPQLPQWLCSTLPSTRLCMLWSTNDSGRKWKEWWGVAAGHQTGFMLKGNHTGWTLPTATPTRPWQLEKLPKSNFTEVFGRGTVYAAFSHRALNYHLQLRLLLTCRFWFINTAARIISVSFPSRALQIHLLYCILGRLNQLLRWFHRKRICNENLLKLCTVIN